MRQIRSPAFCLVLATISSACGGSTTRSATDVAGAAGTIGTGGTGGGNLLPVTGGTSGGGAGGTGPTITPEALTGRAFDVQQLQPFDSLSSFCGNHDGCAPATVLVAQTSDSALHVIWGSAGRAMPVDLTASPSGWQFSGSVQLDSHWSWAYAMCADETDLGPATFDFADHDHDGSIDLVVRGSATLVMCSDDYTDSRTSDVLFSGPPSTRLPSALSPSDPINPLEGVSIPLDKPLQASATAALVPDAGTAIPLTAELSNGYVVGFGTDTVLPLGTRYTVRISGIDFAALRRPRTRRSPPQPRSGLSRRTDSRAIPQWASSMRRSWIRIRASRPSPANTCSSPPPVRTRCCTSRGPPTNRPCRWTSAW